jgi:hypothetical protein
MKMSTVHYSKISVITGQRTFLTKACTMPYGDNKENPQLTAERKRRQNIAECMEQLKELIPSNSNRPDIQQATVLANTVTYIQNVTKLLEEIEANEENEEERRKIRSLLLKFQTE